MFRSAVLLFSLLVSLSVAAFDDREFKTPEGEALYKDLIQELRCLVCQNQNIADSDADLAVDFSATVSLCCINQDSQRER